MKKKIVGFSKGNFQIEKPEIIFPETQLQMRIGEGEIYRGSFLIQNKQGGKIRGIVYPSSFRVQCKEQGFEGNPVKIHFTYDSSGLKPGYVDKGTFTIMCNGGEYELDFTVTIEKPFMMTAYGKIQNIDDFTNLAKQDFTEARRLFRTRQFFDVLKYEDVKVKNLYANMRKWALDEQALEEFLVSIKKKERIALRTSDRRRQLMDVSETKREWIELVKNTWGFLPIHFRTEGDFLMVRNEDITTDEFIGNKHRFEYIVKEEFLHAGKNFGKIYIETPYETLYIDIEVWQTGARQEAHRAKANNRLKFTDLFLKNLSGDVTGEDWEQQALACVKELRSLEPENDFYLLMQAHIYLLREKEEEARWILENYNYNRFTIGKKPELSAYYLFLTVLLRNEAGHTSRVLDELNRLYAKYPDSEQILFMLFELDDQYRDYTERFRMLEKLFENGAHSVLVFTQTYLCLKERVTLLRELNNFEIHVIHFIVKHKLMTQEIAEYVVDLIGQHKEYDSRLFVILQQIYAMYGDSKILSAICVQLIRGNKTGSFYYKWYEKAVRKGLRIAQLYEYFMMSIDAKRVKEALPRIVYLYFMHGMNLDDKRAAILYANILKYEDEESEIYQHYRKEMQKFAWDQLMKRHIDEELRVIYNRFICEEELNVERMEALYDICCSYRVKVRRLPVKYVLVIEKDGTICQRVAYSDEGAKIYLYDQDAQIVLEAKNGVRYVDTVPYESKHLFQENRFLEMCKRYHENCQNVQKEEEVRMVTFENLKKYGVESFETSDIYQFCKQQIREDGTEDEFLLYLCYEVMKHGYYDKLVLTYLAKHYCGATADMKRVWEKAKEYEISTHALSERIISQMLYSEQLVGEEEIFRDYYLNGKPYFRLKQAYLAYVSNEYVAFHRETSERTFQIIQREFEERETLPDICKLALLKFHSGKIAGDEPFAEMLHQFMRELCEKHLVFSWYLEYPREWLLEVMLHDKVIVEYYAKRGSKVKISYQINQGEMEKIDYQSEMLVPIYDTIYVKEFILYRGESIKYYFEETKETGTVASPVAVISQERKVPSGGKYSRLSKIMSLQGEQKKDAMEMYQQEEMIAEQIFQAY